MLKAGHLKTMHSYPAIGNAIIFYGIIHQPTKTAITIISIEFISTQVLKSMAVRFVVSLLHLNEYQAHHNLTRLKKTRKIKNKKKTVTGNHWSQGF